MHCASVVPQSIAFLTEGDYKSSKRLMARGKGRSLTYCSEYLWVRLFPLQGKKMGRKMGKRRKSIKEHSTSPVLTSFSQQSRNAAMEVLNGTEQLSVRLKVMIKNKLKINIFYYVYENVPIIFNILNALKAQIKSSKTWLEGA